MGKPEAYVEAYLVKQAKRYGAFETKYTASGTAGVPDRVVILNGYTVFVETKRPGGVPRKLQDVMMNDIRKHGGYAFAIDTREGIDKLFRRINDNTLERSDVF